MAFAVPLDELAQRRLMIGTPMYEGMCHGAYAAALVELALRLRELGVAFVLQLMVNQSSPERARTIIADAFLRSDCSHLVFIDADMVVKAEDVVSLLALQGEDTPYDVIGGSAPRKSIAWDGVSAAVTAGVRGEQLARYAGEIAVNLGGETREIRLDEPCEVESVGGGFTMIRRPTLERLIERFPDQTFAPDASERTGHGLGETVHHFFATRIDRESRALRSEDYAFCDRVREAGMQVWLCPWMHADHIGNHRFSGNLIDALRLQNNAVSQV